MDGTARETLCQRMALVVDRAAPMLASTRCRTILDTSFDDDVQAIAVARLVSNFEGCGDDLVVDGLLANVLKRALTDDTYASSDATMLRARDALRAYDSAIVAVFEAYPKFQATMQERTTEGLVQLTDWLWRNDTHVRALCDVEGISLQKVPLTHRTTPDQDTIVRAECKRLRKTATDLTQSAKRLRAQASSLESSVVSDVQTTPGEADDDGFKLLLHGRALTEFPYSAIPARVGQHLTLRVPACFSPSLSRYDPTTSYEMACLNAIEHFPCALPRDNVAFVDIRVPTAAGRFYLLDRTSEHLTQQLAGAHLYVINSDDGVTKELCTAVERVLKRPRQ